jgi:hypothetical protein
LIGKLKVMRIKDGKHKNKLKRREQRRAGLTREHPFIRLMGKGRDQAPDVSSSKYEYLGRVERTKRIN